MPVANDKSERRHNVYYLGQKSHYSFSISADQIEIISYGKPKYMHIDARVEIIFWNRPKN